MDALVHHSEAVARERLIIHRIISGPFGFAQEHRFRNKPK
jgi:hypothetical protein